MDTNKKGTGSTPAPKDHNYHTILNGSCIAIILICIAVFFIADYFSCKAVMSYSFGAFTATILIMCIANPIKEDN